MSHYHKRTKREFTGSTALCFNERETLNGIKFPQSLRADHLTLEGGAGGWFWKKFPASARRKKKIACTTNVIESLWEKKGKNVLLTSNLLRWQRPKRDSNAHKSKLSWNDISKLCLFIYFFFALNFVCSVDILSHYHERTQRVFTGSTAPCRVISFVGTQRALYPIFMFHAPERANISLSWRDFSVF